MNKEKRKKRAGQKKQERQQLRQWHPAFYAGIQIELSEEADRLTFENEHHLGTKPKMIDILIIKKESEYQIRKNIGKIFKKHNIIEYKSPEDYLGVDDFYRVYAYACFYKSDTQRADSITIRDITITFACYKYPRKLIRHLEKQKGCRIVLSEPGIYRIEGDIISMQLLLLSKLSPQENLWLSSLGRRLTDMALTDQLVAEYQKHRNNTLYQSVMNLIVQTNNDTFEEAKMMCEALLELFKDELDVAKAEAIKEGRKEGHEKGREEGLEEGISALVKTCNELHQTKDATKEILLSRFSCTEAAANGYIVKYWD